MTTQLALPFGAAKPKPRKLPHNDAETSVEAAERAEPGAEEGESRVLAYLRRCGEEGATREEISDKIGMKIQTVTPRVDGLRKAGKVALKRDQKGAVVKRTTTSGRNAGVLVAVFDARKGWQ